MVGRYRQLAFGGIGVLLCLICALSFSPAVLLASGEDGADEDSPRAESTEKSLNAKRDKSPAIMIKKTVEAQIPKPTLPQGKTLIKQVNIIGSTLLAPEAIARLKEYCENKEVTAREMQICVDKVTRAYTREGYITSYAFIVPDKLSLGILEIVVREGRTGKIVIEGNKTFSTELLSKKITLKEGDLFNFRQLNLDVYRINRHPDRKISIACDPDVEKGVTDVVLTVKDKSPFHVVLAADNYGSEYILYKRYKIYLTHNNITGHDDVLSWKVQRTEADAHQLTDLDYTLPLNNTWKFNGYYMPYKTEDYYYSDNEETDFEKHARKFYFWFNQTLINEPNFELVSGYGFVYKDLNWWKYGQRQKRDNFSALMWGIDFNRADKYGRWVITNDFEIGIPRFLGAATAKDDHCSVLSSGGGYKKNHLVVARRQKLVAGIDFISKLHWQLTSQALTGVNCFSVGGIMGVIDNRGYPRAQAPGDSGNSFSGGFSLPPFGIPRDMNVPFSVTKLYDALRIFTFYDYSRVVLKSPKDGDAKDTALTSVGCGLTFNVPDKSLSMRLDVGWPVSAEEPKDGPHNRPHVWWSVTQGF